TDSVLDVTVEVDDPAVGGMPDDTAALAISIADANEPPTSITLAPAAVDENASGAAVGALAVIDPDGGDAHVLAVPDGRFEIVEGVLRLKEGVSLDFETEARVTLQITAVDSGAPPQTLVQDVVVAVNDVVESLHPWQNPRLRWDVDDDGVVGLKDLLEIVGPLRDAGGPFELPLSFANGEGPPPYLDVNGDDDVSLVDLLEVVQKIREERFAAAPEGERAPDHMAPTFPVAASSTRGGSPTLSTAEAEPDDFSSAALLETSRGLAAQPADLRNDRPFRKEEGAGDDADLEEMFDAIAADRCLRLE
ncbi:MAG: cadherin repeat domain-containing protein, partial [Planctomycetes bacterium]|nr:cadherin repeat domain-containing protein [Planctomycetota bacterium]